MNASLFRTLQIVVEAAWRRCFLIALPFAVIVPLAIVYAKFGPGVYVAKSLLMLQETARDYPFKVDPLAMSRAQDRISGLKALIKSDLVLQSVMYDIKGSEAPTKPKEIAAWVRDFSSALSLDLVGSDFLELQLKGTSPKGLGRQLEAVTARFLEALLSTDDTLNATQVLLERRKQDVDAAERIYAQFKAQIGNQLPPNYYTELAQIASQQQRLVEKTRELAAVNTDLGNLRSKAGGASGRPQVERGGAEDQGQAGDGAGQVAAAAEVQKSNLQPADATLQQVEARQATLQSEVEQLTKSVNAKRRLANEYGPNAQQLQILEAAVYRAREEYQVYAKRYGSQPTAGRAQSLLRAPERIKLIDPPRDPEFPATSAFKIVLAASILSLLIACGLVLAAEMLDQSIRRPEDLEALTGVPVLARLP